MHTPFVSFTVQPTVGQQRFQHQGRHCSNRAATDRLLVHPPVTQLPASTVTAGHLSALAAPALFVPVLPSGALRRAAPTRKVSYPFPPRCRLPTAARHGRGPHGGHGPGFGPGRGRARRRVRSPLRWLWWRPRRLWL